ncbi:MAG: NAD(+) synthase [Crocinitomicaceae bacterium]|nr:NAD(+) synthase [Crocinitomicaceae bacterium]
MERVSRHIVDWLKSYCEQSNLNGFVIGVSGGIDSAVTSILCAETGKRVVLLNMPIRQQSAEFLLAKKHIKDLTDRYPNVESHELELTEVFESFEKSMPFPIESNQLSMANSRARLRMMTLYAVGQAHGLLVAGTGNKIEDFGIGFYTKYGDGGVDLSPIADLTKTEVFALAATLNVIEEIQQAAPTDGLWGDGRKDEDQIGASYAELEWAMGFSGEKNDLTKRQIEVLNIYNRLHKINQHKMLPIPVCKIPDNLKR